MVLDEQPVGLGDGIIEWCDYVSHFEGGIPMPRQEYFGYLQDHHVKLVGRQLPLWAEPFDQYPDVAVWISCGRWVWKCPSCNTGIWACSHRLLTICVKCGAGGWKRQKFPRSKRRIEDLLLKRAGWRENAPDRTWEIGETLAHLEGENIILGVG